MHFQEFEKAIADFSKAIELNPDCSPAYKNLGYLYYQQKDYEKSIFNLKKAIAISPKIASAYCYLGDIYYKKSDYIQALNWIDQAIDHNLKYKKVFEIRAKIYRALDKPDLAAKDEETAKALSDS